MYMVADLTSSLRLHSKIILILNYPSFETVQNIFRQKWWIWKSSKYRSSEMWHWDRKKDNRDMENILIKSENSIFFDSGQNVRCICKTIFILIQKMNSSIKQCDPKLGDFWKFYAPIFPNFADFLGYFKKLGLGFE